MRRSTYWVFLVFGLLLATEAARADSLTFTVLPTDVSGPAGTLVGWGFSITNNSAMDYLDISAVDSSLFMNGTPDASPFLFSFMSLAPGGTITQGYDPVNDLGLFQLLWDPNAPVGFTNTGFFTLYGAFCDPFDITCAEDLTVTSTALATGAYSATVSPAGGATTPEPSAAQLLGTSLFVLAWFSRRRVVLRS